MEAFNALIYALRIYLLTFVIGLLVGGIIIIIRQASKATKKPKTQ